MHKQHLTVAAQYDATAIAYLVSPVHAAGADLEALRAWIQQRPEQTVLDVGCGAGHASFCVAPHVREVVAYDLSDHMLGLVAQTAEERSLTNIRPARGPAEMLPFADATFDSVITRYSAHHWRDLRAALAQITRVLKPDGRLLVMDVASPEDALLETYLQAIEVFRDPSHVKNRSATAWTELLGAAGLSPAVPQTRRLALDFTSWIDRMRTPPDRALAIQSLLAAAPAEVQQHFAIQSDGSFTVDVVWVEASRR